MSTYRKIVCPHCSKTLLMPKLNLEKNRNMRITIKCKACKNQFSLTVK